MSSSLGSPTNPIEHGAAGDPLATKLDRKRQDRSKVIVVRTVTDR